MRPLPDPITPQGVLLTALPPLASTGHAVRTMALMLGLSGLMGASATAVENVWTGAVSRDWNTAGNWSLGRVPVNPNGNVAPDETFDDAVISSTPANTPLILANIPALRDITVGNGAGTSGRLDHTAGNAATGGGNWMFVGTAGGTGVYNLADAAATGGTLSGMGQSTGNLTVGGRLYVGGRDFAGGGTGTVNVNTTGTVAIGNDLAVGSAGGTGVMNVDSGTITTGGWNFIGKNEGGMGANGTLNMSGGILQNPGRTYVGQEGSTGALSLTGGSYRNNNNEIFVVGENNGSKGTLTIAHASSQLHSEGEFWAGQGGGSNGQVNLSAGRLTVNNWVAIGRAGGTGKVTMTGGEFTKTGGGNFIVGDDSTGTLDQSAGAISVNSEFWVGQAANGKGTMNFTGGTVTVENWIAVGRQGATGVLNISGNAHMKKGTAGFFEIGNAAASNGTVNLDGGTLEVNGIQTGGGSSVLNLNGGLIKPVVSSATFLQGLTAANVKAGGARFDTSGFNITINQALVADGASAGGGLTKTGTGTLTLGGVNTYTGLTTVSAGRLEVTGSVAGSVTVSDGAELGGSGSILGTVSLGANTVLAPGTSPGTLSTGALTLSGSSLLKFELDTPGVTGGGVNDLVSVSGSLTLDGTLQITELAGFGAGTYRLFDYTGTLTNSGLELEPAFLAAYPGSAIDTSVANQINLTVVPEPSASVLGLLAGLGLAASRRRSRTGV